MKPVTDPSLLAQLEQRGPVTDPALLAQLEGGEAQQKKTPTRGWSDIPGEALTNAPKSAVEFGKGIYQAVRHPLDTAGTIWDAAAGGLQNALPESVTSAVNKLDWNPEAGKRAVNTADAVGQFAKDRYGSVEGIKNTLATDPVGAAADLSAVLGGGAALASKVPNAAALAKALKTGSTYTNPINAVGGAAKAIGSGAANIIGGLGTHTGGEPLKQAARSGFEGGQSVKAFRGNLRGKAPLTDVLDDAKANIEAMGKEKSAAYRSGMAKVSGDKAILSFDGIDDVLKETSDATTFKGQIKNVKAAETGQKIVAEIEKWKELTPAEFHTPEGLDALKQKIGGIVESIPFEEKTARMVGTKAYNAIKDEIVKQAPVYAKTMKEYSEASEQIREIERALSLGGKASVDTAMRKLQSLTRNNVNTNYGNRLALAKELEKRGGNEIMPALAGQSLSSWTPRGLGSAVAGGLGLGGYAVGGPLTAAAVLAAQSPRLMGEAALKVGQISRPFAAAGKHPGLANILYQAGRLPQSEESNAKALAAAISARGN